MAGSHRDDPIVIEDDENDEPANTNPLLETMFSESILQAECMIEMRISTLIMARKYQLRERNDNNDSCCICLDTYEYGIELGKLSCGHEFHCYCIWKWLKINISCPLCKMRDLKSVWL
ncbi:E3 ubiquitin protein ligase RIE1-like [Solanum lycopersicum]